MALIKRCVLCGATSSALLPGGLDCKVGFLCDYCLDKYGFNRGRIEDQVDLQIMELPEIQSTVTHGIQMKQVLSDFKPTSSIEPYAMFDDESKQLLVSSRDIYPSARSFSLFSYNQIIGYELIENGNTSMSDALDGAIVGGMLFGGAGAVVGSTIMGSSKDCTQLQIKLIVKDYSQPAFYITYIDSANRVKIGSEAYNQKLKSAHDLLAKLSIITNEAKKNEEKAQAKALLRASVNINPNIVDPTLTRIKLFLEESDWENAEVYADVGMDYFPNDYRLYLFKLCAKEKVTCIDGLKDKFDSIKNDSLFDKAKGFYKDSGLKEYEDVLFPEQLERYTRALQYIEDCKYDLAINELSGIVGYKDSDRLLDDCKEKKTKLQQEQDAETEKKYDNAVAAFYKAKSEEDYIEVMATFIELNDYKGSARFVERIESIIMGNN